MCGPGGKCVNNPGNYTCECMFGYQGPFCKQGNFIQILQTFLRNLSFLVEFTRKKQALVYAIVRYFRCNYCIGGVFSAWLSHIFFAFYSHWSVHFELHLV